MNSFASFSNTVNSLGGFIGAFGFMVAAVFGTLYGRQRAFKAQDDSNMSTYKAAADAKQQLLDARDQELKEATARLEHTQTEYKMRHDENAKQIALLQQKADILENQVTQAPSIEKLIKELGKQSTQRDKQHAEQMNAMQKMTQELGNIAKNIVGNPVRVKVNEKG